MLFAHARDARTSGKIGEMWSVTSVWRSFVLWELCSGSTVSYTSKQIAPLKSKLFEEIGEDISFFIRTLFQYLRLCVLIRNQKKARVEFSLLFRKKQLEISILEQLGVKAKMIPRLSKSTLVFNSLTNKDIIITSLLKPAGRLLIKWERRDATRTTQKWSWARSHLPDCLTLLSFD